MNSLLFLLLIAAFMLLYAFRMVNRVRGLRGQMDRAFRQAEIQWKKRRSLVEELLAQGILAREELGEYSNDSVAGMELEPDKALQREEQLGESLQRLFTDRVLAESDSRLLANRILGLAPVVESAHARLRNRKAALDGLMSRLPYVLFR